MRKMRQILLSFLLVLCLCVSTDDVRAESACGTDCIEGQHCQTGAMDQQPQCVPCTNIPQDATPNGPGIDNNPTSCPWTLTCSNGTIFVPNENGKSGNCQTCQQIKSDNNYQSSLGTNSSYQVKWDGEALQYSTDGTTWGNTNPAQCIGKVYEISFNLNSHWAQGSQNPIYQWYGTGYYSDQSCTTTVNQIDIPFSLYQFGGYWTAQNGGVIIFEPNGSLANNVNNKQFTENATIYAHWDNQYHNNNQNIPVKITVGGSASINTECKISDDTCRYTISCPDGYYATGINGNNSGWAFNSETMTLTKSFSSQEKWLCMQSSQPFCDSVHINASECTSGSFCTQCKSEKCPYGAQSDDGATAATQCYFTSIRDNNNKNSEEPWEIPVIENNRAYITQRLIESSGNPSTTTSSVEGD